ncbi:MULTISPECIES: toll/interleukin-1 receptor domain-containing protein [Sorangium]|uniref:toll/interleukin-1 receptor domain-containing protein n=1 Tax=Sorangium TaxID=39643 RepID=UPI00101A799B|nr:MULTISPECIES: toll/interleukin-1 receptor domain-containing protein [Sorangium]
MQDLFTRQAAGEWAFPGVDLFGADLSGADLSGMALSGANLRGANLTSANLTRADLSGVDLSGANLHGAHLTGANLTSANLRGANVCGADLRGANLTSAKLRGANLTEANLTEANLTDANLTEANFSDADLSGAKLTGAIVFKGNLTEANLTEANLSDADLSGAIFTSAILSTAKFCDAILFDTLLLDVDLTQLSAAAPSVRHEGPSHVDYKSILRSIRVPNLKDFLVRTGMPEVFVEYDVACALAIKTDMFKILQSTFISYGAPDEPFARKLYEALHRNGVTTFFFPEHAEPGEKLHRTMRKGVNEYDRVILICSRSSLDRKGVLNELEEILTREARDGGASYLIPIRLDDYVFTGWKPPNADVAQAVRDRVVADFEGAETDDAKFQAGLQKLIRALRKKTVEGADVGKG